MSKPVYVRDVYNYFGYRQLNGNEKSLDRLITDSDLNRPGLELSGYTAEATSRIVILGEREINYINKEMSPERQRAAFDFLTRDQIPMMLISRDLPCPGELLRIAYEKNFPIFSSYAHTNSIIAELTNFLEEFFAEVAVMHGVLLQVYSRGVLITGESGIGKSEIALELIKRGHILVADDRADVFRAHNRIYGEAPEILRGMLELRGIDLVNVVDMFGAMATVERTAIDCIINLQRWTGDNAFDRREFGTELTETIFGIDIPKMVIPVREGRSIAAVIEAAVSNIIMRQRGINSAERFANRLTDYIASHEGDK